MSASPLQSAGAAGQQRSFLDECWTYATRSRAGQQGGRGADRTSSEPVAPALPQEGRGRAKSCPASGSDVLPREPEQMPRHRTHIRPGPPGPCGFCGNTRWWGPRHNPDRFFTCGACHPPATETPDTVWFIKNDATTTGGNP